MAAYIRALQLSQAAKPEDVPSGVQVKSLKEVAAARGHPEFAEPWTLPSTAVQAYPHDVKQGTPAMAPANPADPTIKIPLSKPAAPRTGTKGLGTELRTNGMAHETHAKTLPADLGAPAFVDGWQTRALAVGAVSSVIAAGLGFADGRGFDIDHVLRAWLLGMMLTFGFSVGGLALLMVQYCSGGKWGLLLRRPLEAMSRTLPLVFVYWVVIALSLKKLYLWAQWTMWARRSNRDGSTRCRRTRSNSSGPC